MAEVTEEMSTTRLLTLGQSEYIFTVLRGGYKEDLPAYESFIFKKYHLNSVDGIERIIRKRDGKVIVSNAEAPDIIRTTHEELRHSDDKKTWNTLREVYGNISRLAVQEYINKCQKCITDRHVIYQTLFKNTKPDLENRGHVDVIEMPSDGMYRFVLHYTLVKSSFCILRPIRNNTCEETAFTLHCIFVDFGYPDVLQSHSRKFTSDIIKELSKLCPQVLIISGKYKEEHKRLSLAVKEQLVNWMASSLSTRWTRGLPVVQWGVNNSAKQNSSNSPFQSLFNRRSSLEISSFRDLQNLPAGVLYEEEIKPFLDFCMPVNCNSDPSLAVSCLSVCSVTSQPKSKTEFSKSSELTMSQTNKFSVQAPESCKRNYQSSKSDAAKKIKIIASFSLANGQTASGNKPTVSSPSLDNDKLQQVSDNHATCKTADIPVDKGPDRVSGIHIKQEPVDEHNLETRIKLDDPVVFQTNNEPDTNCSVPLFQIKEELILPDI